MKFAIQDETKCEAFSNIFKNIKAFSNNVNIYLKEDYFYTQFLDTNHICLGELRLASEWFDEYETTEDMTLGIHMGVLSKVLKCRNKHDGIYLEYDEEDYPDIVKISFIPRENTMLSKHYEIPLMDIDTEVLDIPEASQGQADIKIDTTLFSTLIQELSVFGQDVSIHIDEEKIILETQEENGKYSINIDIDKIHLFSIDENTVLKLDYSLKYITMIMSFSKISKQVYMTMGEENPLMFQYHICDGDVPEGDVTSGDVPEGDVSSGKDEDEDEDTLEIQTKNYIRFFLAPKIHDD